MDGGEATPMLILGDFGQSRKTLLKRKWKVEQKRRTRHPPLVGQTMLVKGPLQMWAIAALVPRNPGRGWADWLTCARAAPLPPCSKSSATNGIEMTGIQVVGQGRSAMRVGTEQKTETLPIGIPLTGLD